MRVRSQREGISGQCVVAHAAAARSKQPTRKYAGRQEVESACQAHVRRGAANAPGCVPGCER